MNIIRTRAIVTGVRDLSPTAREVTLTPETPFSFQAGAFVNVFVERDGRTERRAFSISSDPACTDSFTLSVRLVKGGTISPFFWEPDVVGKTVEVMGPLGLNTADKLSKDRAFLVGFGIGVSVIRSLVHYFVETGGAKELTILAGHRNEREALYQTEFEEIAAKYPWVTVRTVYADPAETTATTKCGFLHEHVGDLDFSNADIYLCGQNVACNAFKDTVTASGARDVSYFVESFG